ncbi:hypothetical protein GCM10009557_01120 [Virgisporangium ochraceum]|uniref:Uncharacterized protein n=1 Tax=Virgisporangium ochraceum TaxID=65505 RepID=A0A8J4EGY2_9ACTN|nr:hypothetical protein Voc01_090600 [Virgisporangium ochraceum]
MTSKPSSLAGWAGRSRTGWRPTADAPRPSNLDPFKPSSTQSSAWTWTHPQQRHTVKRIHDRLIAEHDMHDFVLRGGPRYVADREPTIRVEAGPRSTCSSHRSTGSDEGSQRRDYDDQLQ